MSPGGDADAPADGPLYEALVKPGIAVSVYGYPVALHDPGVVQFGVTLADVSQREEAWRILRSRSKTSCR